MGHRAEFDPSDYAPVRSLETDSFGVREFELAPRTFIPQHAHDRLTLVLQLDGGYTQGTGGRSLVVSSGEVVAVPAHETHSVLVSPKGGRAILFDVADDHVRSSLQVFPCALSFAPTPPTRRAGHLIVEELRSPDGASGLVIDGLVLELAGRLLRTGAMRASAARASGSPEPWLARAKAYLDDSFLGTFDLADVARAAGVSRGHLTRVFRQRYGQSIGDYVRWRRVQHAAEQLRGSDRSLAEVALDAGFCDQSHLTRVFRRHFGVTPKAYRQRR